MPTNIQDRGLKRALQQIISDRVAGAPSMRITEEMMTNIYLEVADSPFATRGQVEKRLADAGSPAERLAVVQKGLDDGEAKDIAKMLAHPSFARMLDPAAENFLKAVIGAEPLKPSLFGTNGAAPVSSPTITPEAKAAVAEMKGLIQSRQLQKYYDAAIGIGDASLKDKAIKLFEALPTVHSATTADEMVALGLWTTKPRGIEAMQTSARYLPGRQLVVPAKVNTDLRSGRDFLAWDDNGVEALTYRATLVSEDGDNFMVKIDGKDDPIAVPKETVYKRNQPHIIEGKDVRIGSKQANYEDKFLKAKVCEAALRMDELVGRLDFTKLQASPQGGGLLSVFGGRGDSGEDISAIQRKCVGIIHDVIDMKYRTANARNDPGRADTSDAGRLAVKGIGVCNEQAAVMGAMLTPFQDLVGFDFAMMSGGVYRNTNRSGSMQDQYSTFRRPAHGWIQVTYRPSMEMRIIDRTWQQKDKPADLAYSPGGDRFPSGYQGGIPIAAVESTDVVMDGSVTVDSYDRQFGTAGVDDRTNHMSNRDDH
ncbi:MAG: hypothetical protein RIT81_15200 [Deltaproteobacteria bacterium]